MAHILQHLPVLGAASLPPNMQQNVIETENAKLLQDANNSCIPSESENRYKEWYDKFKTYLQQQHLDMNQDSALIPLEHLKQSEIAKPSSVFSYWSGIKSALVNVDSIDASNWYKVKR